MGLLLGEREEAKDPACWESALRVLKHQVPDTEYRRWFAPTRFLRRDGSSILVGVPHAAFAARLTDRHQATVRKALEKVGAGSARVRFVVGTGGGTSGEADDPAPFPRDSSARFAESDPISKESNFENFVVGVSNRSAHSAALAVSEPDSHQRIYNPLLIYGDVGVGKTHLLQAIAGRVLRHSPSRRVFLTKGESFTRHVVQAIRSADLYAFRDQLREVDLLLVDDIQFIAGMERFSRSTQEFFHSLNFLTERGRQIVLTANAHPQDLVRVDRRVRTRLEAGLTTDVGSPEWETRVAILLKRATTAGVELPLPVAEMVASRFRHNVRELVGALNRILNTADAHGLPITIELAAELLNHGRKPVTISEVLSLTASEFGVPLTHLPGPQRHRDLVQARHVAMYLCRETAGRTLTEIGRALRRDHATVRYGVARIEEERTRNPGLDRVLERLQRKLR